MGRRVEASRRTMRAVVAALDGRAGEAAAGIPRCRAPVA